MFRFLITTFIVLIPSLGYCGCCENEEKLGEELRLITNHLIKLEIEHKKEISELKKRIDIVGEERLKNIMKMYER